MSAIDRNLEIAVARAHERIVLEWLADETQGHRRAGASIPALRASGVVMFADHEPNPW
jgi:hypothetical protein